MRLAIVAGSQRPGAQSSKVARYIDGVAKSRFEDSPMLLDLAEHPLPFLDGSPALDCEPWSSVWAPVSAALRATDAAVLITPEWGGMASPAMKNFLLLCSCGDELRHRPCLLVSVSGGVGGAYPIAELRMSASKNSQACFIPNHVIVRNAAARLNGDPTDDPQEKEVRARIHHSLDVLAEYAQALRAVRASRVVRENRFRNGM
jgi:NAD(P)H-dependent FMN reductase